MKVKLSYREVFISAPRELVFQMLSAIGRGSLPGNQGESSRVLERDDDWIIAEFQTTTGRRTYRTVEEVRLYPPERIAFRHLESPLSYSEEEFLLKEVEGGTVLSYHGDIECRMHWLPGVAWLVAWIYVKPKYDSVIRDHMDRLKTAAEARAARSHVFRRTGGG